MSTVTRIDPVTGAVSLQRSPAERKKAREAYLSEHLAQEVVELKSRISVLEGIIRKAQNEGKL